MQMQTHAEVESALGLPAGSVMRKVITKNPGDTVLLAGQRYAVLSSTHLQAVIKPPPAPKPPRPPRIGPEAKERATAQALFDAVEDEIRMLGTQPCRYGPDGVVQPLTNLEWELLAVSKLAGAATYASAVTASKRVVSMMAMDHAASHRIEPIDIAPVLFANAPRQPCWARIKTPDTPLHVPPEAFKQFLDRIETPGQRESLIRWVGSVLDMRSDRSEYLYLQGEGNDGKSTFIETLNRALDPASTVMSTDILKNDHGSTALEGKRLVIFNEENSTGFAKSATLKRLTGDDAHLINPKNAALRKALLQCKVIYVSNFEPNIQGLRADVRRLAYVVVKPFVNDRGGLDTTFRERLLAQAPEMLRYCWTVYSEWKRSNPAGGKLGDVDALAAILAESTESQGEDLFNKLFTVTGEAADFMLAGDAATLVDQAAKGDYALRATLKRRIRAACGAATVRRIGAKTFRCYTGLTPA